MKKKCIFMFLFFICFIETIFSQQIQWKTSKDTVFKYHINSFNLESIQIQKNEILMPDYKRTFFFN